MALDQASLNSIDALIKVNQKNLKTELEVSLLATVDANLTAHSKELMTELTKLSEEKQTRSICSIMKILTKIFPVLQRKLHR